MGFLPDAFHRIDSRCAIARAPLRRCLLSPMTCCHASCSSVAVTLSRSLVSFPTPPCETCGPSVRCFALPALCAGSTALSAVRIALALRVFTHVGARRARSPWLLSRLTLEPLRRSELPNHVVAVRRRPRSVSTMSATHDSFIKERAVPVVSVHSASFSHTTRELSVPRRATH